jgi:PEP-CTERM motif
LSAPQLIVPTQPGRDLANITGLQLVSVPALPQGAEGIASTAVQLSGNVTAPGPYTLATLKSNFTPVTSTVSGDIYTSVPLWTFLHPKVSGSLDQIVVTQATDGYEVVTALAELDPSLGAADCSVSPNACDLLPYADTGTNFTTSNDGVDRTIFPLDNAHGRWGANVDAIIVQDAPEPASLTILAVGLAGAGLARRRRSARKPAAG